MHRALGRINVKIGINNELISSKTTLRAFATFLISITSFFVRLIQSNIFKNNSFLWTMFMTYTSSAFLQCSAIFHSSIRHENLVKKLWQNIFDCEVKGVKLKCGYFGLGTVLYGIVFAQTFVRLLYSFSYFTEQFQNLSFTNLGFLFLLTCVQVYTSVMQWEYAFLIIVQYLYLSYSNKQFDLKFCLTQD